MKRLSPPQFTSKFSSEACLRHFLLRIDPIAARLVLKFSRRSISKPTDWDFTDRGGFSDACVAVRLGRAHIERHAHSPINAPHEPHLICDSLLAVRQHEPVDC